MNLQDFLRKNLEKIRYDNLYRELKTYSSRPGAYAELNGERVLQFSSNNYLDLAGDKRLEESVVEAVRKYGTGSTGSRLITGTHKLHNELEEKIADLKGTERALVFSTGYATNIGLLSSLLTEQDAVYSDQLNHASIIDGIKLSRANKFIYKHCDIKDLKQKLDENYFKFRINIIITDSIFSMDGDRAPLKEIIELKEKYNAALIIDEAHAFGIYGPNGEGLAHELGLQNKVDIQMGTLSKAAGSEGGYAAGSADLIEFLINRARSFIYSTAPSIPSIAASIKAVEIIREDTALREKLKSNIKYLQKLLAGSGLDIIQSESAIFCINYENIEKTMEISRKLLEEYKIAASAVRPPTVETPRIRICTMASHTKKNLEYLVESLIKVSKTISI